MRLLASAYFLACAGLWLYRAWDGVHGGTVFLKWYLPSADRRDKPVRFWFFILLSFLAGVSCLAIAVWFSALARG